MYAYVLCITRSPFFQKKYSRFTFDPRFTFGKSEVWNENLTSQIFTYQISWEMWNESINFSMVDMGSERCEILREMWIKFLEKWAPAQETILSLLCTLHLNSFQVLNNSPHKYLIALTFPSFAWKVDYLARTSFFIQLKVLEFKRKVDYFAAITLAFLSAKVKKCLIQWGRRWRHGNALLRTLIVSHSCAYFLFHPFQVPLSFVCHSTVRFCYDA